MCVYTIVRHDMFCSKQGEPQKMSTIVHLFLHVYNNISKLSNNVSLQYLVTWEMCYTHIILVIDE